MNWDNVGTFLRVAGSEFQRDGTMKLKERCPNDLSFRFGILSRFHKKTGESETVRKCREMKKTMEVKTLQNGDKQES